MARWKKALICIVCAAMAAALLVSPLMAQTRSVALMSAVSALAKRESVMAREGFDLRIPSGKGWYPKVLVFNADDEFAYMTGMPGARLTILYNFPAFNHREGCSRLFDGTSPYYSGFYGAYLAQLPDGGAYGFAPGGAKLEEAAESIARLDFFGLVLDDFGLTPGARVFEYTAGDSWADLDFAGCPGWVRVDATLRVNGAAHEARRGVRSYLQYGRPNFPAENEFAPVTMYCTVIARYFEQWQTTVFFYVMTPSERVRDECIDNILSKSTFIG